MKRLALPALCLMTGILAAQAPLVPADSLAQRAAICLVAEIPADRNIALDVQTGEMWEELRFEMTRLLLGRDETLLAEPASGTLVAQVTRQTSARQLGSNSLFSRTLREETTHRFRLRLIEKDSGTVIGVAACELRTSCPLTNELQTMRWYDPVLISAILGGLIYLFYYGSE